MPHITLSQSLLLLSLLIATGCQEAAFDGATVDDFDGQLVSEGKAVSFSEDEVVKMLLIHKDSAERFTVRIETDGSFDIGWMPIGEYLCSVDRQKVVAGESWRQPPSNFRPVPGGLKIEERKTEYEIEVGKALEL